MSAVRVVRPVVRSFTKPFTARAIAWARAGGHAVLWETPSRAMMILPRPDRADIGDLARWSLLDLELNRWTEPKSGPFRGLAVRRLTSDLHEIVKNRALRDAVHRGPTRKIALDCLACGACCRDNEVVLEDEDFERLENAGLEHLARAPWARRDRDGRVVLRLAKDERCKHLARDNKCGIYEARPNACREFPAGSECCLWARWEELGIADGDRWED